MTMNDPHVVALFYNIEHGNTVNYEEAEPLIREESAFRLEVADKKASFYLKDHHAQEAEALGSIEKYIRTWEFDACLKGGPDYFKLNFERAEIVDQNPYRNRTGPTQGRYLHVQVLAGDGSEPVSREGENEGC